MVPLQKMVKNILDKNGTISEKGQIPRQNGTISEEGQKLSTKLVPFQKRVKIPQQKWYHFRKGSKSSNKNGTMNQERRQDFHIMLLPWDKGQRLKGYIDN